MEILLLVDDKQAYFHSMTDYNCLNVGEVGRATWATLWCDWVTYVRCIIQYVCVIGRGRCPTFLATREEAMDDVVNSVVRFDAGSLLE